MSLRTSFLSIGGGEKSNWTVMTHPDLKDNYDAYLFASNAHNLLIYNSYGSKLFKSDLKTISFLADFPEDADVDTIYYNNSANKLLLIGENYSAGATEAYISTDTNLTTYSRGTLPNDPYYKRAQINGEIVFGNNYYVIGGEYYPNTTELPNQTSLPAIFYSTNGTSWNRCLINSTTVYRMGGGVDQVGFGNNKFVSFGNYYTGSSDYNCSGVSNSSPTNWSKSKSDFSGHIRVPIIFCNGYFYHFSWSDQLIRSSDGVTWTKLTKPTGFNSEHYCFNVLYYNGLYYLFDQSRIYSTSDFATYKKYKMPFTSTTWHRQSMVIIKDKVVVMRGSQVYYSKISELVEDS